MKKFNNSHAPSETIFIGTALLVGIGTGLAAIIFNYLIQGMEWVGFDWFPRVTAAWGSAYVVIVPTLGGLLVGPMIYFYAREAKGHGVPEVMEAVALRGGRIRPIVAIVKSVASAISIGTGGSAGREGPIVQVGSALGSTLGQKLNFSDDRIRNLVACGAAGGIAATFNAPIAGVIFAIEVILGELNVRSLSSVVVSAVTASVIWRSVLGDVPAFHIPLEYGINSLWEYTFYPVLGLLAALAGAAFVITLYWTEDFFDDLKRIPEWLKAAVGGLLLGITALAYPLITGINWGKIPQIYSSGHDVIESALSNHSLLWFALVMIVLKIIATSLTLGSGGSGGVFAPGLFIGAMVGTAYAIVLNIIFPGVPAPPSAYALVGMGAVFAASAHAPLTAVLIIFEMTGDYRIMLPLMLTVVIATLVAQKLLKGESIYTLKLTRRGIRLQRGRDVDIMQSVLISEVMTTDMATVSTDIKLKELSTIFNRSRHHGLAILDERGKLWGLVTVSDLERAISAGTPLSTTTVADIATRHKHLQKAYPDENIGDALNRMSRRGFGRLPVVSRGDDLHLVGMIQRRDVVEAYKLALTKRSEIQQRTQRMQMRNIDGTEFVDLNISPASNANGKTIGELAQQLPHDCILISIRRDGQVLIPHGENKLQANDQLTAFIQSKDVEQLYACFQTPKEEVVAEETE
jgi:CIC family chloride channel protein